MFSARKNVEKHIYFDFLARFAKKCVTLQPVKYNRNYYQYRNGTVTRKIQVLS